MGAASRECAPGPIREGPYLRLGKPLSDAVLRGVADELLLPLEVELVEDVPDVVLDRLRRDEQALADLLVGVAASDELQHLALPLRERVGPLALREPAELTEH